MSGIDELNRANENTISAAFQGLGLGTVMGSGVPRYFRNTNPTGAPANPYILATLNGVHADGVTVPPAASVVRATVKTATAAAQEYTPQAFAATPATTQVAVAPNGDIVWLAADAVTLADLTVIPELGEVLDFPIVAVPSTGILALSSLGFVASTASFPSGQVPLIIMEAELLTGASVAGKKIVLAPNDAAPATTKVSFKLAKDTIRFTAADVGASGCNARLRLWVSPRVNPNTFIGGADLTT